MTIQILPAELSDAALLCPIGELAFADDAMNKKLLDYSKATPDQIAEARAWRLERTKKRMDGEGKHYFKAVDSETGAISGYAGAYTAEAAASARVGTAAMKPEATGETKEELKRPAIFNAEFAERAEKVLLETKKWYLGEKADDVWYIGSMVVHPDHQGKGIGSKLLAACCELSDKAGKDMYLESTPVGRKLYLKGGFKQLGTVDIMGEGHDLLAMVHPCNLSQ